MGAAVHVVGYEIAGFLEGGCLFGWRFGVGGGGVEGWEDERGGVGDFHFGVAFAAGEFEVVGEFLVRESGSVDLVMDRVMSVGAEDQECREGL